LLPTLTVCGNWNRKGASKTSGDGLATALRMMPTTTATDTSNRKPPANFYITKTGSVKHIGKNGTLSQIRLSQYLQMLPTLCATDWKSPYSAEGYAKQMQVRSKPLRDTLAHSTGHRLTSAFAEWWMGWPIGWTALNAPAMVKFRSQRPQHGESSEARDVR
jgi:hypothetical protein